MDYSLLLAVEKVGEIYNPLNESSDGRKTIELSKGELVVDHVGELISKTHCYKTDRKLYHLAIIDYL